MKFILEQVKKLYVEQGLRCLCAAAYNTGDAKLAVKFRDYLNKNHKKKRAGIFHWEVSDRNIRIEWLDKHIKIN